MSRLFALVGVAAMLGAGCGTSGPSLPPPPAPPPAGGEISAATRYQPCAERHAMDAQLWGTDPATGWLPGSRLNLPADFPPPPRDSDHCGAIGKHQSVWFVSRLSPSEIIDHYDQALRAQGYETKRGAGLTKGDLYVDYEKGDVKGTVYADGEEGIYSIRHRVRSR